MQDCWNVRGISRPFSRQGFWNIKVLMWYVLMEVWRGSSRDLEVRRRTLLDSTNYVSVLETPKHLAVYGCTMILFKYLKYLKKPRGSLELGMDSNL